MSVEAKERAAASLAAVALFVTVAIVALGEARPTLLAGVMALLLSEGAKTALLMKRFSSSDGKRQLSTTVVAEALTFVIAAAVVAIFATPKGEASVVEIATLCATFVAFRIASGLALSSRS